jgi:monoamine oxidase
MNTKEDFGSLCHRRDFLRRALVGSAGLAMGLGPLSRLRGAAPTASSADVIIVGAGLSGLSAATRLIEAGVTPIVLEGRNRVGGRIHTQIVDDVAVDLGAGWIQAAETSPLTQLAKDLGIETVVAPLGVTAFRHPNGTGFTEKENLDLVTAFVALVAGMTDLALKRQRYLLPDISMETAVTRVLDRLSLPATLRTEVYWFATAVFAGLRGATLSGVSLYYSSTDGNLGIIDRTFPGGYGQVPAALAEGVDIRFEHVVQSIDYGRRGVTIHTDKGIFTADRAIVTLPLAVLQSGAVEFTPRLPQKKRKAISSLKVGAGNKYFLRFPTPFWETEVTTILRLAQNPDQNAFINCQLWADVPVICALVEGEYAKESEGYSDDKITSDMMDSLRAAYGTSIPDPVPGFIARSRWHSDPFARGIYPHVPVGGTLRDYETLGEPVDNRLFFAGDATNKDFPGSTRAAFLSGQREAKRVLKYVKA